MQNSPRQVLALCCATHGVQDGISAALNLIMPLLAQAFGLSYAQVGMLRALKSGAMTLFEIPSGVLAERWGERHLLVFGLACTGLGTALLAAANGLWVILVAFVVIGIGNAFQHALCSAIISNNTVDGTRRAALGLYNSAGDAGKLSFTALIALSTGLALAWQYMAIFFAALTLALALVMAIRLAQMDVGSPKPRHGHTPVKGWGIRNKRRFGSLCLASLIDTMVQSGFMVFLVFVLAEKGLSLSLSGFALVLTLIGGMFGKMGCGYLAQSIGPRLAFALAQILTAAGIVALLYAPLWMLIFILPLLGMFLQGSSSITYGTVSELIAPDKQSRGFAMIYSISGISSVCGPIFFGKVSDAQGLSMAMLAMAAVALLAIIPATGMKPA